MKKLILLLCIPFVGIAQTDYELAFTSNNLNYVEMINTSTVIANKTAFSMSCWVYPGANTNHGGIIGFRNNTDADFYLLQLQNTNNIEARFRNSSGINYDIIAANTLDFNQWQHLAFTYDGSYIRLYKNGNLVDNTAANGTITQTTQSFNLGILDYQGSPFHLNGRLDEIRLWDVALSQNEIIGWMCTPIDLTHPNYSNLMGYWKLNDGNGTLVSDASPNSLAGTLYNATWNSSTSCFGSTIQVQGCTDSTACNYNSLATIDDFSCYFLTAQINQNGIDLDVIVSSGMSPYSYQWITGENSIIITPQQNGIFWAIVTDVNGCISDTMFYPVTNITTSINELNTEKILIKTIDVLGRESKGTRNEPIFYIYDDGVVEKRIVVE